MTALNRVFTIAFSLWMPTAFAVGADNKIILPYDNELLGADGFPIYVSDATITSKVPWLKNAGTRLSYSISGMTIPENFTVVYSPTVTGAHTATTNLLSCTHEQREDHFECERQPVHTEVYFDIDPDLYFQISGDIQAAEILPLIRALMTSDLKFAEGVDDPHLTNQKGLVGTIEHWNSEYRIRYGDGGCTGTMEIAPQLHPSSYFVTKAGIDMCI